MSDETDEGQSFRRAGIVLGLLEEKTHLRGLIRAVVALGCPATWSTGTAPDLCRFCGTPAFNGLADNLNTHPWTHKPDCTWLALVAEAEKP